MFMDGCTLISPWNGSVATSYPHAHRDAMWINIIAPGGFLKCATPLVTLWSPSEVETNQHTQSRIVPINKRKTAFRQTAPLS